jgi:hypothetical protein
MLRFPVFVVVSTFMSITVTACFFSFHAGKFHGWCEAKAKQKSSLLDFLLTSLQAYNGMTDLQKGHNLNSHEQRAFEIGILASISVVKDQQNLAFKNMLTLLRKLVGLKVKGSPVS